eukprot:6466916-Amphidinium_carterae.1
MPAGPSSNPDSVPGDSRACFVLFTSCVPRCTCDAMHSSVTSPCNALLKCILAGAVHSEPNTSSAMWELILCYAYRHLRHRMKNRHLSLGFVSRLPQCVSIPKTHRMACSAISRIDKSKRDACVSCVCGCQKRQLTASPIGTTIGMNASWERMCVGFDRELYHAIDTHFWRHVNVDGMGRCSPADPTHPKADGDLASQEESLVEHGILWPLLAAECGLYQVSDDSVSSCKSDTAGRQTLL